MAELIKYDIGRIIEERKKKGISQKKLAEMSGVSLATVQAYEQNARPVKFDTLVKLCVALDLPVHEVAERDELQVFSSPRDFEEAWAKLTGQPHLQTEPGRLVAATLAMEKLNEDGQKEALHLIELLERIPEYMKE